MNTYNIYYKGDKINKECLSELEIKDIMTRDNIYKKVGLDKVKINTKNIQVRKCTII